MSRGLSIAALAWSIPGFVVQVYGLYAGQPFLAMGGAVFLVAGLMFYSKAKGYAPAWGLWGLVPVMGPLILILQPHRVGSTVEETIDRLLIEEDPRIRATNRRETDVMSGGWPLLTIMTPIGVLIMLFCGGLPKAMAPSIETVPVVQAPLPIVMPTASEPTPEPPPTPATVAQPTSPPPVAEKAKSTEERYNDVRPGMTYDEICVIVGNDTTLISGKIGKDAIVKWRNTDKSYFAARFREGRLDRMTHLVAPPLEKRNEEMRAELAPIPAPVVSSMPERLRPGAELPGLAEAEAAVEGSPSETMPVEEAPTPESTNPAEEPVAQARKAVVRVGENVKPAAARVHMARLPKYTQTIGRGPHDIHILNPSASDVTVGLRGAGKRGKDVSIAAKGEATLYLDNGQYSIYYISDDYPEDLNNAGSFTVDRPPDAIVVVLY